MSANYQHETDESIPSSDFKDLFEPDFIEWFNMKFSEFGLTSPDPNIEPCFGKHGKVKPRGEWDSGSAFEASDKSSFEFHKHQQLVRKYFRNDAPYRGILLFHGLGSGKTLTSQAVSESMKDFRQVVVMTPASLRENFISELKKGGQYAQRIFEESRLDNPSQVPDTVNEKSGRSQAHSSRKASARFSEEAQIRREILRNYIFVSYDASNAPAQIKNIPDQFNHKLLIIDEVHNLISMIMSRSIKGNFVFEAMMNAVDLKIIMLSGTPIINDPFELGVIANLLIGYVDAKGNRHIQPKNVEDRHKYLIFDDNVNFYYHFLDDRNPNILRLKNTLKLKRRIQGIISYYAGLQPRDKILPRSKHHLVKTEMSRTQFDLYDKVRKLERASEKKRQAASSQGEKRKTFGQNFVNLNQLFTVSQKDVLMSTFRSTSRQFCNFTFPPGIFRYVERLGDVNAVESETPHSSSQSVIRARHSSNDKRTVRRHDSPDLDRSKTDRNVEIDTGVNSAEDPSLSRDKEVQKLHNLSLKKMDDDYQKYFIDELPEYSSKMYAMMKNIETAEGPVYVYSQFRTLEGIGVFSRILRARGFMEYGWTDPFIRKYRQIEPSPHTLDAFTGKTWSSLSPSQQKNASKNSSLFRPLTFLVWPRSSTNPALRNHLLNVFNSDNNKIGNVIRVFLSTKAGAEGINLMNVRQVHIMEPYWNDMRVRQAIGRAIRQCSHATLPPHQRLVDVYHYVSTIDTHTSEDKAPDGSPESSDQYVRSVALRKQHIIDQVERVMKEVAVDCKLNRPHNVLTDPDIVCFDPPAEIRRRFTVDITQDPSDAELLGDRAYKRVSLVRVKFPIGELRITQPDYDLLQRIQKENSLPDEILEINLYSLNSPVIVYKLVISKKSSEPISFKQIS